MEQQIYDEQLRQVQQRLARKQHLLAVRAELRTQCSELDSRAKQLARKMKAEQADVDRLEGRSLAALFYAMLGTREEKLSQEQQEAYAARVKYDAAERELQDARHQLEGVEQELKGLENCEWEYRQLLSAKAEALKTAGGAGAVKLLELEEKLTSLKAQQKELGEAIEAGRSALAAAEEILKKLDSAEGWAVYDLVGGGLLGDLAKHSALDEAQEMLEQLQLKLRRFKTELADCTVELDGQIRIEGFMRFADYFIDNLFTDWMVMDRIENSQQQVQKTRQQIQTLLQKLEERRSAVCAQQQETACRREEWIKQAALPV